MKKTSKISKKGFKGSIKLAKKGAKGSFKLAKKATGGIFGFFRKFGIYFIIVIIAVVGFWIKKNFF